jgi:hypothetical protein
MKRAAASLALARPARRLTSGPPSVAFACSRSRRRDSEHRCSWLEAAARRLLSRLLAGSHAPGPCGHLALKALALRSHDRNGQSERLDTTGQVAPQPLGDAPRQRRNDDFVVVAVCDGPTDRLEGVRLAGAALDRAARRAFEQRPRRAPSSSRCARTRARPVSAAKKQSVVPWQDVRHGPRAGVSQWCDWRRRGLVAPVRTPSAPPSGSCAGCGELLATAAAGQGRRKTSAFAAPMSRK